MPTDIWTDERIDRLADILENIAKSQGMLIYSVERITETQAKMADAQMQMSQYQPEITRAQAEIAHSVAQLTQSITYMRDVLASTTAAVERLDRLVDYLLRQEPKTDFTLDLTPPSH